MLWINNLMKTMLITGTSRGIGFGCAKRFSNEYNIVGISRTPGEFVTEVGDLTDNDFRLSILEKYNPDIFINNAGIGGDLNSESVTSIIQTNSVASIDLLINFFKKMKSGSDIVNISSISGWLQGRQPWGLGQIAYSCSKHALSAASNALSAKQTQVRVMTLEPENIVTSIHKNHLSNLIDQHIYDNFDGTQRAPMTVNYIVDVIEWMISQPRWVNVHTIRLNNNYRYNI
jgi:NAD(P)-dependent dehydrogenase (short-subunit alcohol dehydrogenase family)